MTFGGTGAGVFLNHGTNTFNGTITSVSSGTIDTGNPSDTLTLANTNSYVGATTISGGVLVPTVNGAMGPATAAGRPRTRGTPARM